MIRSKGSYLQDPQWDSIRTKDEIVNSCDKLLAK